MAATAPTAVPAAGRQEPAALLLVDRQVHPAAVLLLLQVVAAARATARSSIPEPTCPIPLMCPCPGIAWNRLRGPGIGVCGSSPIHIL